MSSLNKMSAKHHSQRAVCFCWCWNESWNGISSAPASITQSTARAATDSYMHVPN